jgi:hypothetical protein
MRVTVTISVDVDDAKRIEDEAHERGMSISKLVRTIILEHYAAKDAKAEAL